MGAMLEGAWLAQEVGMPGRDAAPALGALVARQPLGSGASLLTCACVSLEEDWPDRGALFV